MQLDVKKNARRNIIFGMINKAILMICPFVVRMAFSLTLGAEYLGLNSLFSSVLSVLNLSELGLNSAILSHMYKPIADGDTKRVNSILAFYKKAYAIIGTLMMVVGVAITPILPKLIRGSYPADANLVFIYLVYLINASISYFLCAYYHPLIVAHQRDDLQSNINSIITIVLNAFQIGVLFAFRNYTYYIVLMPIFTVINNLLIFILVKKHFPGFKAKGKIDAPTLASIRKLVTGTFIQKLSTVSRHSMDSIFVSMFIGLVATASYNNYYLVCAGVTAIVSILSTSFAGGIGNHVAVKSPDENFLELKSLDFSYLLIGGWTSSFLICLYQPFMTLWMGKDYLLPFDMVILFGIYYYALKLGDMRFMYISAKGLWWEQRYRSILEAVGNIMLNYILGRLFGMYGIISASIITILIFNFYWGTKILFKEYFGKEKFKEYLFYNLKYLIVNLIVCFLTYALCVAIPSATHVIAEMMKRALVCAIVPIGIYYIAYHKNENFPKMVNFLRQSLSIRRKSET